MGVRILLSSDAVRRAVERQATAALGQPVRIGAFHASVYPRLGLRLRQVVVGDPAALTLDDVSIVTGLTALLRRHVTDAEVVVSNSRVSLPLPFSLQVPGTGRSAPPGDGSTVARAPPAMVIDSIGRIVLHNVHVVASGATMTVDLESALQGDRLEVQRLTARSGASDLSLNGTVTSLSKGEGAFTARADTLDLDELLAILTSLGTTGASGADTARGREAGRAAGVSAAVRAFDYHVHLQARTGRALGVTVTGLTTDVRLTPSGALLDPLTMQLFGGDVGGRLTVSAGPSASAALQGRASGLELPQVLAFVGASEVITGRLAGTVNVQAPVGEPATVFRSATGTMDLEVTNGTVPGLGIVREVVLAFGRPAAEAPTGNGESFTRIAGGFHLVSGVLRSSSLVFSSRDFDMRGASSLNLLTGELDVEADLVLSPELTARAGRDLVKLTREGNRVVLPAKVWGTLAEPRVFVDLDAAMARAAANLARDAAERTMRSAVDKLLRKIKPKQP